MASGYGFWDLSDPKLLVTDIVGVLIPRSLWATQVMMVRARLSE
jgi:hypothetical protein